MKKETKNNIKDTLGDLALVAVCVLLVVSFNNKCSSALNNWGKPKTEKAKPQQPQTHVPDFCLVRPAIPVKTR